VRAFVRHIGSLFAGSRAPPPARRVGYASTAQVGTLRPALTGGVEMTVRRGVVDPRRTIRSTVTQSDEARSNRGAAADGLYEHPSRRFVEVLWVVAREIRFM
jgi:hypothetical protein